MAVPFSATRSLAVLLPTVRLALAPRVASADLPGDDWNTLSSKFSNASVSFDSSSAGEPGEFGGVDATVLSGDVKLLFLDEFLDRLRRPEDDLDLMGVDRSRSDEDCCITMPAIL